MPLLGRPSIRDRTCKAEASTIPCSSRVVLPLAFTDTTRSESGRSVSLCQSALNSYAHRSLAFGVTSVGFDRFRALMRVRGWWDLPRSAPLNLQNFLSFMTAIAHWPCLLKTSWMWYQCTERCGSSTRMSDCGFRKDERSLAESLCVVVQLRVDVHE